MSSQVEVGSPNIRQLTIFTITLTFCNYCTVNVLQANPNLDLLEFVISMIVNRSNDFVKHSVYSQSDRLFNLSN